MVCSGDEARGLALESNFRVGSAGCKGEILCKKWLVQMYELLKLDIQDDHNTCEWTAFYTVPKIRQWGCEVKENGVCTK